MAKSNPAMDLLQTVDLFCSLSKRDLAKVADALKEMDFNAGDVVTAEGDKDARFYIIADGQARVSIGGRNRAILSHGDYFGEIALIDGEPRSATIVAESALRTFTLAPWNFKPLLKENPDITLTILKEMCRRLRSVERSLTQ
jgi:CRP/FNR family cyclic AMP-dependent transcriptional regulator